MRRTLPSVAAVATSHPTPIAAITSVAASSAWMIRSDPSARSSSRMSSIAITSRWSEHPAYPRPLDSDRREVPGRAGQEGSLVRRARWSGGLRGHAAGASGGRAARLLLARPHVALCFVPHRVVSRGLHVEPVVVDHRAAVGGAGA